jgi:uncharacterized lipoprotein YddW (UPF0748 family)
MRIDRPWLAVWLASHHHSPVTRDPAAMERAFDGLAARGVQAVFAAVWNRGWTAWPSAVMERHGLPRQDPAVAAAGFDPLATMVRLGRERGLQVVAWLEYGFAAEPLHQPGPLLARYPQWLARDRRGQPLEHGGLRWLDARLPAVRALLQQLMLEVAERYAVAGVQGDDRIARPLPDHGDATTISAWVRQTGVLLRARRPDGLWMMAPAPPPHGLRALAQDGIAWLRDGSVDLLLPQLYRPTLPGYRRALRRCLAGLPAGCRPRLVPGLALRPHGRQLSAEMVEAVAALNRAEGLGGLALFHHGQLGSWP